MGSRSSVVGAALGVLVVMLALGTSARSQEPARPDVSGTLISEMRALRGAIEQMVSAGARVQLAIGRLQIQEQRVNTLTGQLAGVRQMLAGHERETAMIQATLEDLESVLPTRSDRGERQAIEQEVSQLKIRLSTASASLSKVRADEAELAAQVSAEQGRWSDLNQQLDAIDRTLQR
jgi:predicted  nucleic acid-binding Zn-ribbon protein